MSYRIYYVDVFGSHGFSGNPLAVVMADDTLDSQQMQRIANWLNLSETTFLLPPTDPLADYRVRIFTPAQELPFAGHPTLGSCHAWLALGNTPNHKDIIIQQSDIGLVSIRQVSGMMLFAAPPLLRSGALKEEELESVSAFLNINPDNIVDAQWVDNGPGWVGVRLATAQQVLELVPNTRWPTGISVGVIGPYEAGAETQFEVRAFFVEKEGILEDPVTGSLNASLGQWLFSTGVVSNDYTAAQGTVIGREGRIAVHRDATGQIWVGGHTRTHINGILDVGTI